MLRNRLAVYDTQRGLLSHALYSQVAMHDQYGGVVPELASRDHIRRAIPLLEETLTRAASPARDRRHRHTKVLAWPARCWSASSVACTWAWPSTSGLGIHHRKASAVALAAIRAAEFLLHRPAGVGGQRRLMRVDGVGQYTMLAKRRRCGRRSVRQVGQAAGTRLSGRSAHFAPGRIRHRSRINATPMRTRRISTSAFPA